jgi:hypothetical protein
MRGSRSFVGCLYGSPGRFEFGVGRCCFLVGVPAGGLVVGFVFGVARFVRLAVLEFLQRALCPAYGLGGFVGCWYSHRVCSVVAGCALVGVGVGVFGRFLSDVTRSRFCRLGRRLSRPGFALVTGALLVQVGQVVVVCDWPVGIFGPCCGVVGFKPLGGDPVTSCRFDSASA